MIGQAVPLPKTYNFRGLGSLPAGKRRTKEGVFFRSDALHLLSDEGRGLLRELKVATVLDLRDDDEVLHAPSALAGLDLEVLRGNVLAGALGASLRDLPTLPGLYAFTVGVVDDDSGDFAFRGLALTVLPANAG